MNNIELSTACGSLSLAQLILPNQTQPPSPVITRIITSQGDDVDTDYSDVGLTGFHDGMYIGQESKATIQGAFFGPGCPTVSAPPGITVSSPTGCNSPQYASQVAVDMT